MVYIGNTRHIKKIKKIKILFWSRESKKQTFSIFQIFVTKQNPKILESRVSPPCVEGVSPPRVEGVSPPPS